MNYRINVSLDSEKVYFPFNCSFKRLIILSFSSIVFKYKIEIDLRILNDSTPRFLNQVIKYGKLIFSKNESIQYEFELKVFRQYLDIKPMLDMFDRISIKKVLEDEC